VFWQKRLSLGTSYWGTRIADVFMKAQSSSAIATAHILIGSKNIYRISPDMSAHHFTIDGVRHMPLLTELGRDEAVRVDPRGIAADREVGHLRLRCGLDRRSIQQDAGPHRRTQGAALDVLALRH